MEYQPITSSIVSFSKLVDHFKNQAKPDEPSVLGNKGKTRPYGLVLLSPHDTTTSTTTTKGDLPKVTVVDPVESDRQRAISNLTNEVKELKSNIEGVKRVPVKRKREVKKKQNGKTKSKKLSRKKDSKASVRSVIKRVKDIFD
jgi:hypothetical protein